MRFGGLSVMALGLVVAACAGVRPRQMQFSTLRAHTPLSRNIGACRPHQLMRFGGLSVMALGLVVAACAGGSPPPNAVLHPPRTYATCAPEHWCM